MKTEILFIPFAMFVKSFVINVRREIPISVFNTNKQNEYNEKFQKYFPAAIRRRTEIKNNPFIDKRIIVQPKQNRQKNDKENNNHINKDSNKENNDENDDENENKWVDDLLTPFFEKTPNDRTTERINPYQPFKNQSNKKQPTKSNHFEIIETNKYSFKDVGGYDLVKQELTQCIDMLKNRHKYIKFNVRVPRGLLLEGPPGNGKTLLAKAVSGEANTSFISVSGAEFQDKYVGVGSNKVRELFQLANENSPCIIFIDEIDAVGRKRSSDGEMSSSEKDATLNELLISLDGFKENVGVFLIGATNRPDILDPALLRPGRIDKRIFIGPPDKITRSHIVNIHIKGKPIDNINNIEKIIDITEGFSGSQIENILNEAMLNALRNDKEEFSMDDIHLVVQKITVGWQPIKHEFDLPTIECISVHEMGHAIVGLKTKNHAKVKAVNINLFSPKSPGYTTFEANSNTILKKEVLKEHLMILLGGRIAEEIIYGKEMVSTGAISDLEEARNLAEKMIVYYGMGKSMIHTSNSDKYKETIDEEINNLLKCAYDNAFAVLYENKQHILFFAKILMEQQSLNKENLDFIQTIIV